MALDENKEIVFNGDQSGVAPEASSAARSNSASGPDCNLHDTGGLPALSQSLFVLGLLALVAIGCWILYAPSILQMARAMARGLLGIGY